MCMGSQVAGPSVQRLESSATLSRELPPSERDDGNVELVPTGLTICDGIGNHGQSRTTVCVQL